MIVERDLLKKINFKVTNFISKSLFFKNLRKEQDDEEAYFEQCELASYLRIFKLLGIKNTFYDILSNHIIRPTLNGLIKKAFDARSEVINFMKG